MRPVIALLILGSIATSASAAGTDIHGLVDGETGHTVISEAAVHTKPTTNQWSLLALPILRPWRCRTSVIGNRR